MDTKEENKPLISVIVPIYNVEKYVCKCLDSLKNQTMKEIEVICIDDGSTDGSGKIADEYASDEFPVFRVIHTENRGLSAARNRGLDEAKTDWIMFVDSDDWVDERFCEIPWKAKEEYDADLLIFGDYGVSENGIVSERGREVLTGPISFETAIQMGDVAAWNKLYRKCLFDDIRYPVGRVHEEVATTHKLEHKAKRIVYVRERLYYYLNRNDSITHILSCKNKKDYVLSVIEKYEDMVSYGYQTDKSSLVSIAIGYMVRTRCSDELYEKCRSIVESCELIPEGLSFKKKLAMFIWRVDERLFKFLFSRWKYK